MPLGTRPNQRYEVVLSTDEDLPRSEQPVFIFRYLNVIEWETIATLDDKFAVMKDSKATIDIAFEIIEKTLCGWRNVKMPDGQELSFNFMQLKSLLSMPEVTELMMAAVAQRPTVIDKKKLDSPSDSNTAESAKDAKD